MDANEMTFGIEIETCLPCGLVRVGGYHCGAAIPGLPTGWNAQRDCSIRPDTADMMGVEVVSPVLKGADGLRQILAVCAWLKNSGAKVNESTGFHVHIGWAGDAEALKRLVHIVSNYERALFASTGTDKRERSRFCQGVRENHCYQRSFAAKNGCGQRGVASRYHVLNITNVGLGRTSTVEFRVFSGTTNVVKILSYVRLCLALVEKALRLKKHPKWVAKTPVETSPIHRKGGEGQTELTRLFYFLGWIKGREPHVHGNVSDEAIPSIEEGKKELMRLASKYDERKRPTPPVVQSPEAPAATPAATPYPPTHWTEEYLARWERHVYRGRSVRVFLPDGTDCIGRFVRRYPRMLVVQVSHLTELVRVPRVGNPLRHDHFRILPN